MPTIAITMTATQRWEVLQRTFDTFWDNMFSWGRQSSLRVFVNIDPVGPDDGNTFPNNIRYLLGRRGVSVSQISIHYPSTASFPKAFMWGWAQALTTDCDYIFHLEDDWELQYPVVLWRLFKLFDKYENLDILRLSAFKSESRGCKNWDKFLLWNGDFFEVPDNLRGLLGFAGHPSLIRRRFVENVLPHMDDTKNPEKQIDGHHPIIGPYLQSKQFGLWIPQNSSPIVRDIGRPWMQKNGYRKKGRKARFTEWEKVNE